MSSLTVAPYSETDQFKKYYVLFWNNERSISYQPEEEKEKQYIILWSWKIDK